MSEQEPGPLQEIRCTQLPMLAAGKVRWTQGTLLIAISDLVPVIKAGMLKIPVHASTII